MTNNMISEDAVNLARFRDTLEGRDWFREVVKALTSCPQKNIWSNGDEILCKTDSAADALADMFEGLYAASNEDVLVNTGYYDPEEDERNGEVDRYTGWWYVYVY